MLNYGNLNKMDERQYYLNKIAEEALEVATAAMKCMQFGNESRDPSNPDSPTNEDHLVIELADLEGAVLACHYNGFLGAPVEYQSMVRTKIEKINKYREICVKLGTVK